MRYAISTDVDTVSAHFGRCPTFTIVDVQNNQIIRKEQVKNPGHEPGLIPQFLNEKGVQCIIAGGMGGRAQGLFQGYSIDTILGVTGSIDAVLEHLIAGTLANGESLCSPGGGKGYGLDKTQCTHGDHEHTEK